jgi:hypothetical protein
MRYWCVSTTCLCLLLWQAAIVSGWAQQPRDAAPATAEEMMLRAHAARATWEKFPGFRAKVQLNRNGQVFSGEVLVGSDGAVSLQLPQAVDLAWAQRKLDSLVAHRLPTGETSYNVQFADDELHHPLGRLIRFNEDRLHSVYRIRGDVITEVHRQMGETRFTISVVEVTRNAEGKYLPRTYTVSFWDGSSGALRSTTTVHNAWVRVGGFDLPRRVMSIETADGGRREVYQIVFSGHELLPNQ